MTTTRKIILTAVVVVVATAAFLSYRFLSAGTRFGAKEKVLYIPTGKATKEYVLQTLKDSGWLKNPGAFNWLASTRGCWSRLKPGRYEITKGMSLWQLVQKLRGGRQDPIKFTITKLRTNEDLAEKISRNFECRYEEVMAFINSPDSLEKFGLDSNTVMCGVIPNTYSMVWNSSASKVLKRLFSEADKFWTEERKQKAKAKGHSTNAIYTLASIVDEETRNQDDKGKIASVYFNRLRLGMPLQADPTIKFAIRNFGLSRILNVHKEAAYATPYDTYKKTGLPPGPICTSYISTLDAVLDAPATSYIFFIAQPNLTGLSDFSETLDQHEAYRVKYNRWQDSSKAAKKLKEQQAAVQSR